MDAQTVVRAVRTPLILLVLLGLVVAGAAWAWREVLTPPPATQPDPCVAQPIKDGKLRSSQVTVDIENAGTKRGLAGQVATSLEKQKFIVDGVGNAEDVSVKTVVVVGFSADAPEVQLVAAQFPNAEVRADENQSDHRVKVLLGDDYPGTKKDAPKDLKVEAASVCLPAPPTASPSPSAGA